MDEGVDTGRLIGQFPIEIPPAWSITELQMAIDRESRVAAQQLGERLVAEGALIGISQGADRGSVWRRRTEFDVQIDCRMSAAAILRLVNSYAKPYPMAKLVTQFGAIAISQALIVDLPRDSWEMEVIGRVMRKGVQSIAVRVDDGVIALYTDSDFPGGLHEGDFLLPPAFFVVESAGP
jgi:methionyl-tRNA formyltransferase